MTRADLASYFHDLKRRHCAKMRSEMDRSVQELRRRGVPYEYIIYISREWDSLSGCWFTSRDDCLESACISQMSVSDCEVKRPLYCCLAVDGRNPNNIRRELCGVREVDLALSDWGAWFLSVEATYVRPDVEGSVGAGPSTVAKEVREILGLSNRHSGR